MSMQITVVPKEKSGTARLVEWLFHFFLRAMAVAFFVFTIYTWLSAIGYWPGDQFRFDTMSTAMKVYTAVLLVLHPVVSVGLWTTLSWGRVVWFMAIGFQTLAIMRFEVIDGTNGWLVIFNLTSLAIYVVFQLGLVFIHKEE